MSSYLEISDVSLRFKPDAPRVLRDVTLMVEKGEYVAIIGHSGCGKSTLLNVVAGLLEASGGGVVLDGREVSPAWARPRRGVPEPQPAAMADLPRECPAWRWTRCSPGA